MYLFNQKKIKIVKIIEKIVEKVERIKKAKVSGAISVYLCLVFAVIVSLLLIMYEAANYSAMKLHVECATDSAMDSCLAEYNEKLLAEYGLLFVDSSYGESQGSVENVANHFDYYMSNNLDTNQNISLSSSRDLFGASLYRVDILKTSRATDNDGEVFRYMAVSYMLEHYGIAYATELMDSYESSTSTGLFEDVADGEDIDSTTDQAFSDLGDFSLSDEKKEEYGIEGDIEYDHPEQGVQSTRAKGLLATVCKKDVSLKSVDLTSYSSKRSNTVGDGMYSKWDERNEAVSNVLFNEYVVRMTSNYVDVKSEGVLDYELEYVIAGKDNDMDNLKSVVTKLLLIRGIANTTYFFSDTSLVVEAETMASGLSLACGVPELEPLFKAAICAAWIYAESTVDVRKLLDGKRVSLVTSREEWDTSLTNVVAGAFADEESSQSVEISTALQYRDYLGIMLFLTDTKSKTYRMMDVVEMNMRHKYGYETFRMDNCMAAFEIQALVECRNGYSVLVKKQFGYQ